MIVAHRNQLSLDGKAGLSEPLSPKTRGQLPTFWSASANSRTCTSRPAKHRGSVSSCAGRKAFRYMARRTTPVLGWTWCQVLPLRPMRQHVGDVSALGLCGKERRPFGTVAVVVVLGGAGVKLNVDAVSGWVVGCACDELRSVNHLPGEGHGTDYAMPLRRMHGPRKLPT
jgi:hypothetical protein